MPATTSTSTPCCGKHRDVLTTHLERGNLDLDNAEFLVLDEMDRMLDMGFSVQIDRIVKYMPEKRQTLLFSATMPDSIIKMAKKYQNNPERTFRWLNL